MEKKLPHGTLADHQKRGFVTRTVPMMRECELTMNDGTVVKAEYATRGQLRAALVELIRVLEMEEVG